MGKINEKSKEKAKNERRRNGKGKVLRHSGIGRRGTQNEKNTSK